MLLLEARLGGYSFGFPSCKNNLNLLIIHGSLQILTLHQGNILSWGTEFNFYCLFPLKKKYSFVTINNLMDKIVVTFNEWSILIRALYLNSFPRSSLFSCCSALRKNKDLGQIPKVIFASFCCSPSPNFAEQLYCSIGKLSLKFLPIHRFPGAMNCVPVQMELLPSLFS